MTVLLQARDLTLGAGARLLFSVLARIVELEELLAADHARKPRHQKPQLRAAWQQELDGLYARLE